MGRQFYFLFISLFMLAGCLSIPTDEAACLITPTPTLEETKEMALAEGPFEEGDFPPEEWWLMFDDSQLNELIETALCDSPTLEKVAARLEAAEAEAKVKRSRLFPTIGFRVDVDWGYYSENDFFRAFTPVVPGNVTEYELNFDFSYELDLWGKNQNIYRAKLGLARAQRAEEAMVRLSLTTSVATAYFKLQAQMKKLALLKRERRVLTRLFQLNEERTEVGIDALPPTLAASESLDRVNFNLEIARQRVELTEHMLKMLIGLGPDAPFYMESKWEENVPSVSLPKTLAADLLARRPDLMAQIWRVEAAAHLVGAAKADFYPSVDLFALAGLDSIISSKFFSWKSRTGHVRPALHLPIFTAGKIKAHLRGKQAEFEESIYAYNEMILSAAQEVADSVVTLTSMTNTLEIQEKIVETAEAQGKIASAQFKHAITSLLDFLAVRQRVIQAEIGKVGAEYQTLAATVHLIKALGGGYLSCDDPLGGCE